MRRAGYAIATLWLVLTAFSAWLTPHEPSAQFRGRAFSPPHRIRVMTEDGALVAPFFYPQRLRNRLERRFEEDRARPISVRWLSGRRLFASADPDEPLLVLGADNLGRDVFSRLVAGARTSLTLALVASLLALLLGAAAGLVAGYVRGATDAALTRLSEFVLVLPALYVVIALRAALPLVLSPNDVFLLLAAIFALVAWPATARGVRAIVATESTRDYVEAARAAGARRRRIIVRHLLPATTGFLAVQFALLIPACLLVEGTLSYAGLGFPEHVATWGTMLQEAANIGALAGAPWLLAPAVAIVTVVLAANLIVEPYGRAEQHRTG